MTMSVRHYSMLFTYLMHQIFSKTLWSWFSDSSINDKEADTVIWWCHFYTGWLEAIWLACGECFYSFSIAILLRRKACTLKLIQNFSDFQCIQKVVESSLWSSLDLFHQPQNETVPMSSHLYTSLHSYTQATTNVHSVYRLAFSEKSILPGS